MDAREVMTRDVVRVGPDTTVGEIAAILVRHRISAVPVVSGTQLLGIVSQISRTAARPARRSGANGGWSCSPIRM